MLSDIRDKEQSTDLKKEPSQPILSIIVIFSNSDSHQRVTIPVTTCKGVFYIKTEENTRVTTSHHFFIIRIITYYFLYILWWLVVTRCQMCSFHWNIMVTSVVTRGDSYGDPSICALLNYQSCSRRFYLNQCNKG